ncbi:MAG TPA: gamma-glutamyltransferase [Thermoanaerobaculia bacterium]|nr:gamma-glutamyltransferase [Thermoanaerobaculia bacterium]
MSSTIRRRVVATTFAVILLAGSASAQRTAAQAVLALPTDKPVLHGQHWVAVTGKPLAATAGAMMFLQGGNAVDAACAMLAATSTMWDTLGWGGETQALVFDPRDGKVKGINALGVAPTGATADYYREQGMRYPPEYGPLAAVTPGTPGGLMVMLAELGTMSLEQVLAPAIQMADGYPIEASQADNMERQRKRIAEWPSSRAVFLPHLDESDDTQRAAPYPGEIFRQPDLLATLQKLVEAERSALRGGAERKSAIQAAYDRFYRGDIAQELVRGTQEGGGLITVEDLASWRVHIEEPVKTEYKGIEVYKLTHWTQGPAMLQALNVLEHVDREHPLREMGYNSARYLHAVYQAMNLAFADRDFYYGDPYFPPEEPIAGLLSKDYAKQRAGLIDWSRNRLDIRPGDPYPFQGSENPYLDLLQKWRPVPPTSDAEGEAGFQQSSVGTGPQMTPDEAFYAGTTSIQAADAAGWVVSITPSGAWVPAYIAGRTGIGLSQRAQSFVLDPGMNPFNVIEPGKRPRVTLTPSLALRDGKPYLAFSVQGGDSQDQNLLQFFLNVVEFGMNVQQASEAANIASFQMQSSFGDHRSEPGRLLARDDTPEWVVAELRKLGYRVETARKTSGPITAIWFDREHGTMWGGASDHGDDYGIAW